MEGTNGKKLEHRLTVLKTSQDFILDEIKDIKDNHLRSIYKKLDRLLWLLLTGLIGIISALLVLILIK